MNLCRCEQGHFYDKEKYASCPHCAGGSAFDDKRTEAFTEDFTVPIANTGMQPQPTAPAGQAMPFPAPPMEPVADPLPPIAPLPQTAPPISPLPVAGMAANQMTMDINTMAAEDATVPLDFVQTPPPQQAPSDDDHTIGFFDDVFSDVTGDDTAAKNVGAAAPKPVANSVNKVKTPCVGWLLSLGGEHIGTDFRLKVGKNFIGRSPHMDVALTEDKSVSRESHAIVVYEPRAHLYLVQPGESSSLVYRNNEVVLTPVKLEAYDTITVGEINLLFIPLCGERFNWGDLLEEMRNKNR